MSKKQYYEVQRPRVEVQDPPLETNVPENRHFWPKDKPLPQAHHKLARFPMPCPACRRVLTVDGGQASACTHSGPDVAFYYCRTCGHRWQMPVLVINNK